MSEQLHLTYALLSHGQTDALRDGRVRPNGIEWDHIDVNPPPMIYRRMVRHLEFDVAEVAMTTFLCAKALERPISALPVFSNRDLTLSPIVCRADSDIEKPGDLQGKRVGIRSYTETNTTQARALLRSELGLDTDRVNWIIAFKTSKQLYLDDLPQRSPLGERDKQSLRNMEIVGGDPLPYGLGQNRKSVEGMVEMNLGQHIIPRALDVDSLFAPGTLDLE